MDTPKRVGFQRTTRERKATINPQRKQLILSFIHEFRRVRGFSPTCVEIAQGIGYSENTGGMVHMLVRELVKEGWLATTPKVARSIVPQKDVHEVYCLMTDPDLKQVAKQQKNLRILK